MTDPKASKSNPIRDSKNRVRLGVFATNGSLVEKAVKLIEMLGTKVATPAEGRAILGLKKP